MRELRGEELLATLVRHGVEFVVIGGYAATIGGSPFVTFDVDITPSRTEGNLERLSLALKDLNAKIRAEDEVLPFSHDGASLGRVSIWNLVTDLGDLDIAFEPQGTHGFVDLAAGAYTVVIAGENVRVAALADVIRSKEAAGRDKDRRVLPVLRDILRRQVRG